MTRGEAQEKCWMLSPKQTSLFNENGESLSLEMAVRNVIGESLDATYDKEEFIEVLTKAFWVCYISYHEKNVRREMDHFRRRIRGEPVICDMCGKETKSIELHHIVPAGGGFGGGNEPENIWFLCHECHKRAHKSMKNANYFYPLILKKDRNK